MKNYGLDYDFLEALNSSKKRRRHRRNRKHKIITIKKHFNFDFIKHFFKKVLKKL